MRILVGHGYEGVSAPVCPFVIPTPLSSLIRPKAKRNAKPTTRCNYYHLPVLHTQQVTSESNF